MLGSLAKVLRLQPIVRCTTLHELPLANKRLTIDVPESLHRAIKMQCASRGAKIADEVRELLMQKYGNQ